MKIAGWFVLGAIPLLLAAISAPVDLAKIVDNKYIAMAKVEKIFPEVPGVIVTLEEDIKGKLLVRKLSINFEGDSDCKKLNHTPQLLKRLASDLPLMLFVKFDKQNNTYLGMAYTNGTWFSFLGEPTSEGKHAWKLTHGEPNLRKTFKGSTASLKQIVVNSLAGTAKLPPKDEKEPPGFGPEIAK